MGKLKVPRAVLFGAAVFVSAVTSAATTRELFFQPGPYIGKDAYVWQWYGKTNFGDKPELKIYASTTDICRSYVEFVKIKSYAGSRYNCLSATLSLFYYSHNPGPSPWLRVYRAAGPWEENKITWNNRPGFTGTPSVYRGPTPEKPAWVHIDVTEIVSGWFSGKYKHYGFVIRLADETCGYHADFFSSDNPHDEKPKLRIKYRCTGVEPASLGKIKAIHR